MHGFPEAGVSWMKGTDAVLAAFLGAGLAACGPDISTDRTAPPLAAAVAAQPAATDPPRAPAAEPSAAALEVVTVLYAEHDAEVRALRAGVVRSVAAELADPVQEGALLGALDGRVEEAMVASAEASAALARARHERALKLADGRLLSPAELEEAVFELRMREAELQEAQVRLSHTRMEAPFDGVVSRRFIRVGQWVEEGDPLFRVTALRPLQAQLRLPEEAAARMRRGDTLEVRGSAGQRATARVDRIAPAVDPSSGTVEVLVRIPQPGTLQPGGTVSVLVPGGSA